MGFGLGIGGIFGKTGLLGPMLDRLGMRWMSQALRVSLDVATGDYVDLALDVSSFVSRFNDMSFMSTVSQVAPLWDDDGLLKGGCFEDCFSSDRAREIEARTTLTNPNLTHFSRAVALTREVTETGENFRVNQENYRYNNLLV